MVKKQTNRTEIFRAYELDLELWQKLYYSDQQEYLRKRLRAIKAVYEGQSRYHVCRSLGCSYNALTKWIDVVLLYGLETLVAPIKHPRTPQQLSPEQKKRTQAHDSGTLSSELWYRAQFMDRRHYD